MFVVPKKHIAILLGTGLALGVVAGACFVKISECKKNASKFECYSSWALTIALTIIALYVTIKTYIQTTSNTSSFNNVARNNIATRPNGTLRLNTPQLNNLARNS